MARIPKEKSGFWVSILFDNAQRSIKKWNENFKDMEYLTSFENVFIIYINVSVIFENSCLVKIKDLFKLWTPFPVWTQEKINIEYPLLSQQSNKWTVLESNIKAGVTRMNKILYWLKNLIVELRSNVCYRQYGNDDLYQWMKSLMRDHGK